MSKFTPLESIMNSLPSYRSAKILIWLLFIPVLSATAAEIKPLHLNQKVCVIKYGSWAETMIAIDAGPSLIVVDTLSSPKAAAQAKTYLEDKFGKKVSHVVNTHHHWDHTFGNQVFTDAEIIGHVLCVEDMQTEYGSKEKRERMIQNFMESTSNPEWIAHAENCLTDIQENFQLTFPSVMVGDRETLKVGDITFKLFHVPGLHTRSNLTIHIPELGLIFTRREFRHDSIPVLEDGVDMAKSIRSLEDILESNPPLLYNIVGHGDPIEKPDLRPALSYLKALNSSVEEAQRAGLPRDRAFEKFDQSAFPLLSRFLDRHRGNWKIVWDSLIQHSKH